MSTYRIMFTTDAALWVEVEADDYNEAVEKAYDEMPQTDFAFSPFELGEWEDEQSGSYVDGEAIP